MTIDDPSGPLFNTAPLVPTPPVAPPPQQPEPVDLSGGGRRHAAVDPPAPEGGADQLLAPPPPTVPPLTVPPLTVPPLTVPPPAVNGAPPSQDGLRTEMSALLGRASGQLKAVYDLYSSGTTSPAALAAAGAAASEPAAAAIALRIRTILGEPWTGTPGQARPVAATIRGLLRAPDLSRDARQHLTDLRTRLLEIADSDAGRAEEQAQLEANSVVLQRELRSAHGVAVHTYPHYWRYPYIAETNRLLVKIGANDQGGWQRVLDQSRDSGAPEDPVLLRVYIAPDPVTADTVIHRLLDAAGHTRHATHAGAREWFATTLEFLDEIARALSLEIKAGAEPVL